MSTICPWAGRRFTSGKRSSDCFRRGLSKLNETPQGSCSGLFEPKDYNVGVSATAPYEVFVQILHFVAMGLQPYYEVPNSNFVSIRIFVLVRRVRENVAKRTSFIEFRSRLPVSTEQRSASRSAVLSDAMKQARQPRQLTPSLAKPTRYLLR